MKFLFLLLLGYYAYRTFLKPYFSQVATKEEETVFRFDKKTEPQKQTDESDYIDYEEVD